VIPQARYRSAKKGMVLSPKPSPRLARDLRESGTDSIVLLDDGLDGHLKRSDALAKRRRTQRLPYLLISAQCSGASRSRRKT
jgi:hypothetical protein